LSSCVRHQNWDHEETLMSCFLSTPSRTQRIDNPVSGTRWNHTIANNPSNYAFRQLHLSRARSLSLSQVLPWWLSTPGLILPYPGVKSHHRSMCFSYFFNICCHKDSTACGNAHVLLASRVPLWSARRVGEELVTDGDSCPIMALLGTG
jgi:hypothetical protein